MATVLCGLSWMVKVEEMLSVIHPLSDVSIVTGDGWRRCILCCPLLPITKAGCGMMEERTSGPLLPVIKAGRGGRLAIKKTATTLGDAYGAQLSAHPQC